MKYCWKHRTEEESPCEYAKRWSPRKATRGRSPDYDQYNAQLSMIEQRNDTEMAEGYEAFKAEPYTIAPLPREIERRAFEAGWKAKHANDQYHAEAAYQRELADEA